MNKKFLLPFTLSSLMLALTGCGGESTTIKEDPYSGVTTSSNGCDSSSTTCHSFVIAYPVAGLNFDCSSDSKNHFVTELEGNTVTGGCPVGDKVSFYLQGQDTSRKVDLGTINLADLSPLRVSNQPVQIGVLDLAKAMTGQDATEASLSDSTFKVAVGLTRLFQAIGQSQDSASSLDVQPIEITTAFKNKLSNLTADVTVDDFKDGSYVEDLKPWVDLNSVTQSDAVSVTQQQINLKNVGIYSASFLALKALNVDLGGFYGSSKSSSKEAIANLYALTDRQGYSIGYAVQWRGVPINTGSQLISDIGRINLLTQTAPEKLNVTAQDKTESSIYAWINPLNDQIQHGLTLQSGINTQDVLNISQGRFYNQKTIPGNAYMYQQVTGLSTAPTDSSVYGKWTQKVAAEEFTGSIDLHRTNPATYLSNSIFKTINTVKSGQKYIFPLYANLTFKFEDSSIPRETVGIVIDENGDIRTNRSATALASNVCSSVDANYVDTTTQVQQYRIGTTGAANSTDDDKSITIRMILANPIFGRLDGAIIGLNESFMYLPQDSSGSIPSMTSGGVRLNLQNLVVSNTTQNGINITGWNGATTTEAQWVNMHAVSQSIYNAANDKATTEQQDLAKRQQGAIEKVDLLPCYEIKTKA